jgi:hypothetical protein
VPSIHFERRNAEVPEEGCGASFVNPQRSAACIAYAFGDLALYTVDLTTVALGIHALVSAVTDGDCSRLLDGEPRKLSDRIEAYAIWVAALWEARGVQRRAQGSEERATAAFGEAAARYAEHGRPLDKVRCEQRMRGG